MIFPWLRSDGPFRKRSGTRRSTFRPDVEILEGRQLPSTIIVTSNADSGAGTLREALTTANAQTGLTTIDFDIGTGPQVITVIDPLPVITSPVFINGASQPGWTGPPLISLEARYIIPFAATVGGNLLPPITSPAVTDALNLFASGCTVEGLEISGFINGDGIAVTGNNEMVGGPAIQPDSVPIGGFVTNGIAGNLPVGVIPAFVGNVIVGNQSGIVVGGVNNVIAGNVVNQNLRDGIDVSGSNAVIEGNLIGTNAAGNQAMSNGGNGVSVIGMHNTIGGTTPAARNVISGNRANGVNVNSVPVTDNIIEGNYIGTNATGSAALANQLVGVMDTPLLVPGVTRVNAGSGTTIGGSAAGAGNVISSNGIYGIVLSGSLGAMILGNKIGADATGNTALPNRYDGIYVIGASGNTISGNLLSGNGRFGLFLLGQPEGSSFLPSSNNVVQNNIIGLGQNGGRLGNVDDGVALFAGATNNTIGGTTQVIGNAFSPSGNFISGNGRFGVYLNGAGTTGNLIEGNRIGTGLDGTSAQGNTLDGIAVFVGPANNTIGGTGTGAGNVISGNGRDGVYLANAGPGNVLESNFIGTSNDGNTALGNNGNGIAVQAVAGTTIGGTAAGAGNVISGNIEGVVMIGASSTGNLVEGNFIGTDKTATTNLRNRVFGVDIQGGASNNTVGGTASGAGNTIAFNGQVGVVIGNSFGDVTTVGDSILGNSIFENGPAPPLLSTTPPGINLGDNNGTSPPVNVAHVGPNHLQDAPEVTSVVASGSGTAIAVTLSSFPNQVFRIEFFADANAGIQGRKFLGAGTLTTDSSGSGTLTITVPTPLSALVGQRVTATATNESTGDTSEFGAGHFVTGT